MGSPASRRASRGDCTGCGAGHFFPSGGFAQVADAHLLRQEAAEAPGVAADVRAAELPPGRDFPLGRAWYRIASWIDQSGGCDVEPQRQSSSSPSPSPFPRLPPAASAQSRGARTTSSGRPQPRRFRRSCGPSRRRDVGRRFPAGSSLRSRGSSSSRGKYRIPPPCIAHNSSPKTTSRVCHVGRVSSDRLLVLLGDSHAFMWLPAVLELAWRDGWHVVPLIRFGCTPGAWIPHEGRDTCRAWLRWSIGEIRRLRPAITLLGGSIGERPSSATRAATRGVIAAARTLRALGPLVVIGDPEGLSGDPVPCLVAPGVSMSSCTTTWPQTSLAAYDTVAREARRMGAGFLPTRGFVCHQRQCPAVVHRTIVWMDNSHLTGVYSAELAEPFRAAFLRASP